MKIATSTKEKSIDFERVHIPEEMYDAELVEVKDISDGQFGERVAFIYRILSKKVELAYVCYKVGAATKDNKLGQALIAHGVELNDKEVDTEHLPRKQVRVLVEDYKYTKEKDGKQVSEIASTISKVKPLVEVQKV